MTGKFKQKLQTIKQIIGIGKPKRKISLYDVIRDETYVVPFKAPFKDECSIGRSRSNDVVIPQAHVSMQVSRKHCVIYQDFKNPEKPPSIMDCNSLEGTYVRGKQIKGDMRASLFDGDEIELAEYYRLIINIDEGKK